MSESPSWLQDKHFGQHRNMIVQIHGKLPMSICLDPMQGYSGFTMLFYWFIEIFPHALTVLSHNVHWTKWGWGQRKSCMGKACCGKVLLQSNRDEPCICDCAYCFTLWFMSAIHNWNMLGERKQNFPTKPTIFLLEKRSQSRTGVKKPFLIIMPSAFSLLMLCVMPLVSHQWLHS